MPWAGCRSRAYREAAEPSDLGSLARHADVGCEALTLVGDRLGEGFGAWLQGIALHLAGDPAAALERYEHATHVLSGLGSTMLADRARTWIALAYIHTDARDRASELCAKLLENADLALSGLLGGIDPARRLAAGDATGALESVRAALPSALERPGTKAVLHTVAAAACLALGDARAALAEVAAARAKRDPLILMSFFEAMLARVECEASLALEDSGHDAALARAVEHVERLAATLDPAARARFLALPDHARILELAVKRG